MGSQVEWGKLHDDTIIFFDKVQWSLTGKEVVIRNPGIGNSFSCSYQGWDIKFITEEQFNALDQLT